MEIGIGPWEILSRTGQPAANYVGTLPGKFHGRKLLQPIIILNEPLWRNGWLRVWVEESRRMRLLACFLLWLGILTAGTEAAGKLPWAARSRALEVYAPPAVVRHNWPEAPGTIIVDTASRRLFLLLPEKQAIRYTVAVGRQGFGWHGSAEIGRRAEWPEWVPPREMAVRAAGEHRFLPYSIDGGPFNPLGARALYLFQGKHDTLIRIHGTNEPKSIGRSVSSGCIRMRNDDIIDLYGRVVLGTPVIVW